MTRPPNLPDYRKPPIDEVAIGVQFPPIDGLTQAHFGLLWTHIRSDYPSVQSQPRIEGPIESLNESPVPSLHLQTTPRVSVKVRRSEAEEFERSVDVPADRSDAGSNVGVAGDPQCTDRQIA